MPIAPPLHCYNCWHLHTLCTDASLQDLRGNYWLVVVTHICEGSGLLRVIVCNSSDKFINCESLSLDCVTLHCFLL